MCGTYIFPFTSAWSVWILLHCVRRVMECTHITIDANAIWCRSRHSRHYFIAFSLRHYYFLAVEKMEPEIFGDYECPKCKSLSPYVDQCLECDEVLLLGRDDVIVDSSPYSNCFAWICFFLMCGFVCILVGVFVSSWIMYSK